MSGISQAIALLEERVQRDEGARGIGAILVERGELEIAARAMCASSSAVIMTGFPCMLDYEPPTETDGPLGALCIARCLLALGKNVTLITDECNEECLLACAAGAELNDYMASGNLTLESFPGSASFFEDAKDAQRLQVIRDSVDLIVAIERAGPSAEGLYLTMRGRDMTAIVAPLDDLIEPPTADLREEAQEPEMVFGLSKGKGEEETKRRPVSIGIGDGGNEVGMGKVYHRIVESSIANASQIACVVPTDHLLVASVSNWGGYALSAAAALVAAVEGQTSSSSAPSGLALQEALALIDKCLPSDELETKMCSRLVEAGARDGISGQQSNFVDGMPLETSLQVLSELREIAKASCQRELE